MKYDITIKTARLQAMADTISSDGPAFIEIGTAGMATVLASIPLPVPCGTVAGDVLTFSMPRTDNAPTGTGQAVAARIRTGAGVYAVTELTVGTADCDINLDDTSIVAGQAVTITYAAITHAQ